MDYKYIAGFAVSVAMMTSIAVASTNTVITIPMTIIAKDGLQKDIGVIKAQNATGGVLLTPQLHDLPPGIHGFHIHAHPSCDNNGMAAGDHLDPANADKHRGPYNSTGHLGDLPVLVVNADGTATLPMLAPRFKLNELHGHPLMIHAGADNYSDTPAKNGGGADRYACGVIK